MDKSRATVVLLILNLAVLVWIGWRVTGPTAPAAPSGGGEFTELATELRALTAEFRRDRPAATSAGLTTEPAVRIPVDAGEPASLEGLVTEIRALREALERATLSSAAPEVSLGAAAASAPPKDAAAVRRLIDDLQRDQEKTRRALLFAPATQTLLRLGRPDEVTTDGGAMNWYYYDEDGQGSVQIVILDGLVVQVWG